jgi:alpha-galactosidase
MDYMTPGSLGNSSPLPANNSLSAQFYHNAIKSTGAKIRLDLSWKLERDQADWEIWRSNADGLRLDTDINGFDGSLVAWASVQRVIEQYRSFINQQEEDPTRLNIPIMIRPDLDDMYTGNAETLNGVTDVQRYTIASHWVGTGGNLISGADLTQLDALGTELMYDAELLSVADFTAQYPMQPINPEGTTQPGAQASSQLQAWIAGPNTNNKNAVVVLANYGPDEGSGGYGTSLQGNLMVNATLELLGIAPGQPHGAANGWSVRRVLGGGGAGGADHTSLGVMTSAISSNLGPGESALYYLTAQD